MTNSAMKKIHILITVVMMLFFVGCADQTQEQSSAVNAPDSATVTIKDNKFLPDTVTIKRGGTVTWVQEDSEAHSIVIANGISSSRIEGGEKFTNSFEKTGNYNYACGIHPQMKGRVIVK